MVRKLGAGLNLWLASHPFATVVFGGLLAATPLPLLDWLGLGLVTLAILQQQSRRAWMAVVALAVLLALVAVAYSWYLLKWPVSAWLLFPALPLLVLFASQRSWPTLLLLSSVASLLLLLLLGRTLDGVSLAVPEAVLRYLPTALMVDTLSLPSVEQSLPAEALARSAEALHLSTAALPVEIRSLPLLITTYIIVSVLVAAVLGRALQAQATAPGAFGREFRTFRLGYWVLWPLLLWLAWSLAGNSGLAVVCLPLMLATCSVLAGLRIKHSGSGRWLLLVQWVYLLACALAWVAAVLGYPFYGGALILLPLLWDAFFDFRGRALVRKLPQRA